MRLICPDAFFWRKRCKERYRAHCRIFRGLRKLSRLRITSMPETRQHQYRDHWLQRSMVKSTVLRAQVCFPSRFDPGYCLNHVHRWYIGLYYEAADIQSTDLAKVSSKRERGNFFHMSTHLSVDSILACHLARCRSE